LSKGFLNAYSTIRSKRSRRKEEMIMIFIF
jgi:hypothetical protein